MANSKKKCKECKSYFPVDSGTIKPFGFFCSEQHAYQYAIAKLNSDKKRAIEKQRAKSRKQQKIDRKAALDAKRNNLGWQLERTQKAFNKMRRLEEIKWFQDRDLEPICISCGSPKGNDMWANGHFKSVGSHPELRFDPKNCYLQHNKRCNSELSGDIYGTKTTHGYLQGLKNRFGEKEGQRIIDYCESHHQPKKHTCSDLQEMRKAINKKIRWLEERINDYSL